MINARLLDAEAGGGYGICPALSAEHAGPLLVVERTGEGWRMQAGDGDSDEAASWPLPEGFDPGRWQQWRVRVTHLGVTVSLEDREIGRLPLARAGTHAGVAASFAHAAFDMVRVTALA